MQTTKENIIINVQEIEPRLRHQTIFDTFDTLQEGERLIIHNNHDPKPVFYQLINMRGNIFTWEYMQQGPQWWDISVTRIVPAHLSEGGTFVINVPILEPQQKHASIFQVFDSMMPGEAFIIHNDHDPKPMYYQLLSERGEIFTWEYVTEGPQWWDIKVTINPIGKPGETVINVPSIEPSLKHQTIFHAFANLHSGESFIIHNNHDPKPVFFQLKEMHGDVFSWEYLKEGPQWWDIRVTRIVQQAPTSEQNALSFSTNPNGKKEITITIPSLEPKLKHPTIFKIFDELLPEESLIIHNDHDPKPVYYQLLGERGDVFTWEYLQQGPQWWDIRVTRKPEGSNETIGQIAAKDLRKAEVFKKYGIDFCCGGKKTLREVCAEKGIDATLVEQELQKPIQNVTTGTTNFDEWNLDFLVDYIVNTHHKYVRKYLPEITAYSAKVTKVHGDKHPELATINELVAKINAELTTHLQEEENIVFPLIKDIVKAQEANRAYANDARDKFISIIATTEAEHDSVGRDLEKIRALNNNYAIPEDACASYTLLYKMLEEFEADLFVHIHLENNILFPKALEAAKA